MAPKSLEVKVAEHDVKINDMQSLMIRMESSLQQIADSTKLNSDTFREAINSFRQSSISNLSDHELSTTERINDMEKMLEKKIWAIKLQIAYFTGGLAFIVWAINKYL